MKRFLLKVILMFFCTSSFHLLPTSDAISEDTGLTLGGFQWGGSMELGYRLRDIDGSKNRYKEVLNLTEGVKLFDLSVWGKDAAKKGIVDYFSLNLNGIGDPFPFGRLEVKKDKTYDLVATYREYKYFFDREDNSTFTDNHNFNSKQRMGTVNLTIFPKDDFKLNFGYSRTQRDGEGSFPRIAFAPSVEEQDFRERLNQYFISADFPIGKWDFHVKQSYWNYENKDNMEGSYQIEKRNEKVGTYVSTLKAHTQFGERWDIDMGYIYGHSDGRADLTLITETTPESPYTSGKGKFDFNTHILELGLSHLLRKDLILHLDYRFHTFDQDGLSYSFSGNGVPYSSQGDTNTAYNLLAHTGTLQLEYLPRENLTLRGGYRVQYRDIDAENWVANPNDGGHHSKDTNTLTHGWIASGDWKPYKFLSIYGEYQGAQFDNPYTRISPETENLAKIKIKYVPIKGLNLIGNVSWKRRTNPDQEYRVDIKDYVVTGTYQPSFIQGLSLDASFTYENIHDKKNITNSSDSTTFFSSPFTYFNFDSDAFIYYGGISYEGIFKGLGAKFYGHYAKTLKDDRQIYADGAVSVWYKNKWVTPIITLQRAYLLDRVNRNDSFAANLVTFSLRKEF